MIRRRVDLIRQLKDEMGLDLTVQLVPSAQNHADKLTRVPSDWIRSGNGAVEQRAVDSTEHDSGSNDARTIKQVTREQAMHEGTVETVADEALERDVSAASAGAMIAVAAAENRKLNLETKEDVMSAIASKHQEAGHPGVRRTMYFARRDITRSVTRGMVQAVVAQCQICKSVDPAPVNWRHGSLDVRETWWRLAIDITHFQGRAYLTVVDCGPSRFSLWRPLRQTDTASVLDELGQIFYERGAPAELLGDNDTAFRSRSFAAFASRWGVSLRFRAVYRPSGNSIVERNHKTVKVIAARKRSSVAEAVHLYNISPRETDSKSETPARGIYCYQVRDCVRHTTRIASRESSPMPTQWRMKEETSATTKYNEGDMVWMRKPGTRCSEQSKPGIVTKIIPPQVVEVEGMPWHIRDLRHRRDPGTRRVKRTRQENADELEAPLYITAPVPWAVTPARVVTPKQSQAVNQVTMGISGDEEAQSNVSSDADFATPDAASSEDLPGSDIEEVEASAPSPIPLRRSTRLTRPPDRLTYS